MQSKVFTFEVRHTKENRPKDYPITELAGKPIYRVSTVMYDGKESSKRLEFCLSEDGAKNFCDEVYELAEIYKDED